MEAEGKVIEFRPLDEPRFVHKRRSSPNCLHAGAIEVDEQDRTVECGTCGAVLDPFDYLLDLSKQETVLDTHIKHFRLLKLSLVQEIEKLEKKVKYLRSTVNKLEK